MNQVRSQHIGRHPSVPVSLTATAGEGTMRLNGNGSTEAVIAAFLLSLDVKPSTKKSYSKALDLFFRWVSDTDRLPEMLQREDIIDYREMLLVSTGHSAMTVSLYLSAIRQFYSWLEAERSYPNIARGVKTPHHKEEFIKQHLSAAQSNAMLSFFAGKEVENRKFVRQRSTVLRDFAIVNLMLRTGLRTIEVSRLKIQDVTFRYGKRILKVWGKGHDSADDFVPIPDSAWNPIADYLQTRPEALAGEPLFITEGYGSGHTGMSTRRIQAICKEGLRAIGLDDHAYSAHSLRHTCAVQILKSGGNIYDVKYLLRHQNPATSELYVKSIEEELRLERAPEKYLDNIYTVDSVFNE